MSDCEFVCEGSCHDFDEFIAADLNEKFELTGDNEITAKDLGEFCGFINNAESAGGSDCMCFANGVENEEYCESGDFTDAGACEDNNGRCHWGPGDVEECHATASFFSRSSIWGNVKSLKKQKVERSHVTKTSKAKSPWNFFGAKGKKVHQAFENSYEEGPSRHCGMAAENCAKDPDTEDKDC